MTIKIGILRGTKCPGITGQVAGGDSKFLGDQIDHVVGFFDGDNLIGKPFLQPGKPELPGKEQAENHDDDPESDAKAVVWHKDVNDCTEAGRRNEKQAKRRKELYRMR